MLQKRHNTSRTFIFEPIKDQLNTTTKKNYLILYWVNFLLDSNFCIYRLVLVQMLSKLVIVAKTKNIKIEAVRNKIYFKIYLIYVKDHS